MTKPVFAISCQSKVVDQPAHLSSLISAFVVPCPDYFIKYRKVPRFSDRLVWANSADPDQRSSLIEVYTVCNSLGIFWMHYSKKKPSCSTFRVITPNFWMSKILRFYGIIATVYI